MGPPPPPGEEKIGEMILTLRELLLMKYFCFFSYIESCRWGNRVSLGPSPKTWSTWSCKEFFIP